VTLEWKEVQSVKQNWDYVSGRTHRENFFVTLSRILDKLKVEDTDEHLIAAVNKREHEDDFVFLNDMADDASGMYGSSHPILIYLIPYILIILIFDTLYTHNTHI